MRKKLTEAETALLKRRHKSERSGDVRDRIKAVILSDKGWSAKRIAEALLIHLDIDPGKRQKRRQEESKDLVHKLFASWKKYYSSLPKKSATAQAIAYALNNETALKRFLDDGRIAIDNNAAERAMRSIVVGRKNWLFAGSDRGGDIAADRKSVV